MSHFLKYSGSGIFFLYNFKNCATLFRHYAWTGVHVSHQPWESRGFLQDLALSFLRGSWALDWRSDLRKLFSSSAISQWSRTHRCHCFNISSTRLWTNAISLLVHASGEVLLIVCDEITSVSINIEDVTLKMRASVFPLYNNNGFPYEARVNMWKFLHT